MKLNVLALDVIPMKGHALGYDVVKQKLFQESPFSTKYKSHLATEEYSNCDVIFFYANIFIGLIKDFSWTKFKQFFLLYIIFINSKKETRIQFIFKKIYHHMYTIQWHTESNV